MHCICYHVAENVAAINFDKLGQDETAVCHVKLNEIDLNS